MKILMMDMTMMPLVSLGRRTGQDRKRREMILMKTRYIPKTPHKDAVSEQVRHGKKERAKKEIESLNNEKEWM